MNSTERWDDVPRGTMDEVSSSVRLDLPLKSDGKAALQIVPPRLRIPCWKGRGADSEEKHEPASDIDTVVVDSLKALDPRLEKRTAKSYCSQYMMNSLKVSTQDLRHAQRLLRNLRQTLRHRQRKEGLSKQRLQRR